MNDDAPYDIQINNKLLVSAVDDALLHESVLQTLRRFNIEGAEISIALVGDEEMAELHEAYLNVPGPTDVLTFDLSSQPQDPQSCRRIDGEIVISIETARRQAELRGHAFSAELALYAVHGTLHLLGLSDATEHQASGMHRLENDILTAAGIGPIYGD